jgi:predicted DNA-binding transcriptional regulator AlpA
LKITIQAREILKEKIEEERSKLPFALTANHLSELLGISKRKVYDTLAAGDIPGVKKLISLGGSREIHS